MLQKVTVVYGQEYVVIPDEMLDALGLDSDEVEVEMIDGAMVLTKPGSQPGTL